MYSTSVRERGRWWERSCVKRTAARRADSIISRMRADTSTASAIWRTSWDSGWSSLLKKRSAAGLDSERSARRRQDAASRRSWTATTTVFSHQQTWQRKCGRHAGNPDSRSRRGSRRWRLSSTTAWQSAMPMPKRR